MPRSSYPQAENLWLAKVLWDLGAIQFGDFTLGRTTQHSPVYVNLRLLISEPRALRRVARVIRDEVQTLLSMRHPRIAQFDLVAGIPFGGLHLATAFSLTTNVPLIYVNPNKSRSTTSNQWTIEGRYQAGQTVLLIDDLATTGGSIIETATELQMASLIVRDAIVLVNRDEGARERLHYHNYNLIPILSLDTILNYLMATGRISEDWYKRSIDYIERRRAAISFPLLSQDKPEAESE